jgi:hypothetical protein
VKGGQAFAISDRMRVMWKVFTWMTVWKRASHWEMPNRMRVKGKYSYLDDNMKEGQALVDAQQDEHEVEVLFPGWQGGRGQELRDA